MLVEDDPLDVFLVQELLREQRLSPQLFVASDGEQAIRLLEDIDSGTAHCPDVIVLDINLPRKNGFEVLQRVRATKKCWDRPVVMLTSSDTRREREIACQLGVVSYLKKPSMLSQFIEVGEQLKSVINASGR